MKSLSSRVPAIIVGLALASLLVPLAAQPAGHWEGAIELPGTQLQIRVDLVAPAGEGAWSGSIDIPAQMIRAYGLADVTVDGGRVFFRMPDIPGDPVFEGSLAAEDGRLSGTFRQSGQVFPFSLERRAATARAGETPSQGVPGEGLAGHWQGSLRTGPVELRLVLHVAAGDAGALTATIDSLDQGANGIPVSQVNVDQQTVELTLAVINAAYAGELSPDGSELRGRWKQGPLDTPLVFRRLAAPPELLRPQDPRPPYPYEEHEVSFPGGAAGVTLAATLTVPAGAGPFPAVVLMSGSGPQDRNETVMGHRPFLVLADHLTRRGIAVLRYDDRGYSRSTGSFVTATHEDLAADGLAALRFLQQQPRIDPARVGLCGHSEGGLHAPLVAARAGDVAFIVMLAGVGVPIDQLIERQQADVARVMGIEHTRRSEEVALANEIFATLRDQGGSDAARVKVRTLLEQIAAFYTPAQRQAIGFDDSVLDQQLTMLTSPWFVALLGFDPGPALAQVRCPVLALNGEKDVQVAASENLAAIRAGLEAGGNANITTHVLPGLNHLFQHATTGAIAEYGTIEETMSPEVLTLIADWILRQTSSS